MLGVYSFRLCGRSFSLFSVMRPLLDLPSPSNLTFMWNFGSLLFVLMVVQVFSGLVLSTWYNTYVPFEAVDHLCREVCYGSFLRNLHAVGSSLIFIVLYLHMGRALLLYSKSALTWLSGVVLFLLLVVISFLGYTLPWGTMSYWAATVILSLFTVILPVEYLYADYIVSHNTLCRIYTLHFLLPFVLLVMVCVHVVSLHSKGSSAAFTPVTIVDYTKLHFHPLYTLKDSFIIVCVLLGMCLITLLYYSYAYHPDNFSESNPLQTPAHIEPEWYFLWMYAILRCMPSKLGGIIAVVVILLLLALSHQQRLTSPWSVVATFFILTYVGSCEPSYPYDVVSRVATVLMALLLSV
uniref:Cytochrome b n=1 Tax=Dicyema sp. TaxID=48272 RepID=A0A3G1SBZ5_9BILA|nr:cytochrome b [Dicyema sp.]